MEKLGASIPDLLAKMSANNSTARLNLRIKQVRARYKEAIETVYGPTAQLFLEHTNNVYITDKNGVRTLIVYVDDSIFAADLNAQRELINLKLLELFGEEIETFDIFISRGNYKNNHPYLSDDSQDQNEIADESGKIVQPISSLPLTEEESAFVASTTSSIEDSRLRECIQKAMTADLEWKKYEKRGTHTENTK